MSRSKLNLAFDESTHGVDVEKPSEHALSSANKLTDNVNIDTFDEQPTAQYISDLLAELSFIASKANLSFLTYLIDIAHEEARIQAKPQDRSYL